MQSHEILREVFSKNSPKKVAESMGLSLSMIYKWAEKPGDRGSGTLNPLDRIDALMHCTGDSRIAEWISQRAGGFFIGNPKTKRPHPYFMIPATNEIIQEFAEMLSVIAEAALDHEISESESADIRARWEKLKSVTECFVKCCEDGNFSGIMDNKK
ncbi:MAG TPA: hypothetical protein EYG38_09700 [Verrucomicrobia bacterium]|nr:hypothetical protein [Verrucomicrobiota bacterium]